MSQELIQGLPYIQSSCLLGLILAVTVPLTFVVFMTLTLGGAQPGVCRMSLSWDVPVFFSRSQWGDDGFAEVKCPSHPFLSRDLLSARLVTVGVDLGRLAEAYLSGSPLHRYRPPLSTSSSSEGSHCAARMCGVGVPLQVGGCTQEVGSFCKGLCLPVFIGPILCLYQHELTDTLYFRL